MQVRLELITFKGCLYGARSLYGLTHRERQVALEVTITKPNVKRFHALSPWRNADIAYFDERTDPHSPGCDRSGRSCRD
jgi:hypothetical protein